MRFTIGVRGQQRWEVPMVTGPIQQPSVAPTSARPTPARRPRANLLPGPHALSRALDTEPYWRERLLRRLGPVRQEFAEHVRLTEGPAGRYAELLHHAPRLQHGVTRLVREHSVIVAALDALRQAAERPGVAAEELRRATEHLVWALARHRQRGADLLWQAYQTDLGGED
ncbi:hypothetical protein ACN26Y_02840 [Micromonospora sp. WMMD558]|uniref:hypothetical protein n=1 Tax=Micromonospora sp. WMMD558 TaxID=3403462 RepID=UPI003BF4CEFC